MTRRLERIAISGLRLPGDIAERATRKHVKELAESIREHGLQVPILVELGTMRLVAGRDRVAAHKALGLDQIEAVFVSGSESELEQIEIIENLQRRHDDKAELMVRYLDIVRKNVAARNSQTKSLTIAQGVKGRPVSDNGQALEEAARDLGTTAQTLRNAERQVRREEAGEDDTPPLTPDVLCLNTLGVVSDDLPAVLDTARLVQDAIDRSLRALAAATQALAPLREEETFSQSNLSELRERLITAKFAIAGARPAGICPYCKLTKLRNDCGACGARGFVSELTFKASPNALREQSIVYVQGRPVQLKDIVEKERSHDNDELLF